MPFGWQKGQPSRLLEGAGLGIAAKYGQILVLGIYSDFLVSDERARSIFRQAGRSGVRDGAMYGSSGLGRWRKFEYLTIVYDKLFPDHEVLREYVRSNMQSFSRRPAFYISSEGEDVMEERAAGVAETEWWRQDEAEVEYITVDSESDEPGKGTECRRQVEEGGD